MGMRGGEGRYSKNRDKNGWRVSKESLRKPIRDKRRRIEKLEKRQEQ